MAHPIGEDGLIEHFTLRPDERERLVGMSGAGRIGFGLALKYLLWKGRFPRTHADLPTGSVEFVARQVGAAAGEFDHYDWQGRQIQRHRAQIRELTGFREPTVTDAAKLTEWLTGEVCQAEPREDRVRDELLARCREELLEPPGPTRIARIVGSAMRQAEQTLTTDIAAGIPVSAAAGIRVLGSR